MSTRLSWRGAGLAVATVVAGSVVLPVAVATNTGGGGAGVVLVPIVPCRLFDTRGDAPVGQRTTPLGAGETFVQQVTGTNGNCTIPPNATAVAMNVTTTNSTSSSFLTVWPADAAKPLASNLNWTTGAPPTPNKVDVKLSADGKVSLFNNAGSVDVIADVVGYYTDHDHDDRYYTKAEVDQAVSGAMTAVRTDRYGPWDIMARFTVEPPTNGDSVNPVVMGGSCVTNADLGAGKVWHLPIDLPVGATLISVTADIWDSTSTITYQLALVANTLSPDDTGYPQTNVVPPIAGGSGTTAKIYHYTFTPSSSDGVVTADNSFELQFTGNNNSHGAFCGATVTWRPGS